MTKNKQGESRAARMAKDYPKKPMPRTIGNVLLKFHDTCLRPGDRRRFLLRELPKGGVGCELGVWKGEFSSLIMKMLAPSRLYLIDPWLYQPALEGEMYGGGIAKSQSDMDDIQNAVRDKFAGDSRVRILHKKSADVSAADIPDGSLDWIYIDGVHEYDDVAADLRFAMQKCKPEAVICGDDYDVLFDGKQQLGVMLAVTDFLAKNANCELAWIKRRQFFIRRR
ncbi:MAG: class I SAM-dependent methyltransferase [Gammaproteobacteria bacterium]